MHSSGPSTIDSILENVERNLGNERGNETERYPIEILFEFLGMKAGDQLRPFGAGVSVGFATVLSCFVIGHAMVTCSQWSPWSLATILSQLGPKLLKCFRLTATYDPPSDTADLISKSVGRKIQGANRQRPHPLQLERALSMQAREVAAQSARRKSSAQVYDELVTAYNRREKIRACKLLPEETACIKLIARECEEVRALLEVIWGEDKMANTAVPLSLLAAKFLNEESEVPVSRENNAKWHHILQVTPAKRHQFLLRCWLRFQHKVQETINKGKNPNLRNYAGQYREADSELTWRIVCAWHTEGRPRLLGLVKPEEMPKWDLQFYRGFLDSAFNDKCRALDPSFQAEDLAFIRTLLQGSMADWTPDKLSEALSSAAAQKLLAEFNLLAAEVRQEGLAWSRWLSRKAELEDAEQSQLTKARVRASEDLEAAVGSHCGQHFIMECPKDRSNLGVVLASALAAFCAAVPKKNEETCLRLNVIRMDVSSFFIQ